MRECRYCLCEEHLFRSPRERERDVLAKRDSRIRNFSISGTTNKHIIGMWFGEIRKETDSRLLGLWNCKDSLLKLFSTMWGQGVIRRVYTKGVVQSKFYKVVEELIMVSGWLPGVMLSADGISKDSFLYVILSNFFDK